MAKKKQKSYTFDSPLALMKYDMGPSRYIPGKHLDYINNELMKLINGETTRLCLILPPRHGKSTLISVYFPAYCMMQEMFKNSQIMQISYAKGLVEGFTTEARNIVQEYGPYELDDSVQRKDEFKLARPNSAKCFSMGVQGGITGKGADRYNS